ncbi:heavy-metal-associated domain-containing protein [Candidatus Pacearchaeota archaeon]|nr:heavy-metal-associated domain-containing protein [Candidatus Pacearchaeota archaeon]
MKKIKLTIQGMHCASCASNIERSLKKVSGVKEVTVSAVTNKAFVEVDEKTSEEEMKKAVSRAGYKIVGVEEE